jgi:hypothetical protein
MYGPVAFHSLLSYVAPVSLHEFYTMLESEFNIARARVEEKRVLAR